MKKKRCPETGNMTWVFKDDASVARFEEYGPRILMLYRASPEDKHMLVAGLKGLKARNKMKNIAMTGDSIADAPALRAADVGMCMEDGCHVAKDQADFIILDNDYRSVFNAAKWGRNIFESVRKFLQF